MKPYNKPSISKYFTVILLGLTLVASPNSHSQNQSDDSITQQSISNKGNKGEKAVQSKNSKRKPAQYTSYYYECNFFKQISKTSRQNIMSFNIRTPDNETELVYNKSIRSISLSIKLRRNGQFFAQVREYGQEQLTAFKRIQIQGFDPLVESPPPIDVFLKRQISGGVLGYSLECR